MIQPDSDTLQFDSPELCRRIAKLTRSILDFWADGGWAQSEAANLLDRSMLYWQSSLAESLSHWLDSDSEGDLILAWANLGALVEGQLKLFLCVYYHDYATDMVGIRRRGPELNLNVVFAERNRRFRCTPKRVPSP